MRVLAAAAIVLLSVTPAGAQELFGVRIGDTLAQAQTVMPEAKLSSSPDRPREAHLYDARRDRLVGLCDGLVFSTQEQFGSSVHDFASEAKTETMARGSGETTVRNSRTTAGEMSSISIAWPASGSTYELSLFQPADAPVQATRRLFKARNCR